MSAVLERDTIARMYCLFVAHERSSLGNLLAIAAQMHGEIWPVSDAMAARSWALYLFPDDELRRIHADVCVDEEDLRDSISFAHLRLDEKFPPPKSLP